MFHRSLFNTIIKLLIFRLKRDEMLTFSRKHFITGLIGTWLVGIGRYWDDPDASVLQHAGFGSVIYIFILSLFIWLIVLPFKPEKWTYFHVLTFISLTSFPAALYAIPVERFYSLDTANTINVWFLAVVALWRLLLLGYFIRTFTRLHPGYVFTITLLPICVIITSLTILNLERAVFDIMGGRRNATPHDQAYGVLVSLTFISVILLLPLLITYIVGIVSRKKELKKDHLEKADNS